MARSGYQPESIGIAASNVSQLKLNWSYKSGAQFAASPIEYNGLVYAVDYNGALTALNAQTGQVVWQRNIGEWVEQTPAVYDGLLFVGTHDTQSTLLALDPATGNIIWQQQLPGGLKGSPVVVGGELYEGVALGDQGFCRPGGVYALNEQTGNLGMNWLVEQSEQPDGGSVWAPIAYDGTSIYYGTGNTCTNAVSSANAVASMNSSTLEPNWTYQTANALSDDDVGGGMLVNNGVGYVAGKNGYFYAFNLQSGSVVWSEKINTQDALGSISTPVITENTIVTSAGGDAWADGQGGVNGGSVIGMTLAGQKLWSISTKQEVRSSAVATSDLVFVGLDNAFTALDPHTGKILWSYTAVGEFAASPALAKNNVYVADTSGTLYAFTEPASMSASVNAQKSRTYLATVRRDAASAAFLNRRPKYCGLASH